MTSAAVRSVQSAGATDVRQIRMIAENCAMARIPVPRFLGCSPASARPTPALASGRASAGRRRRRRREVPAGRDLRMAGRGAQNQTSQMGKRPNRGRMTALC
jgi:hypothetical protein